MTGCSPPRAEAAGRPTYGRFQVALNGSGTPDMGRERNVRFWAKGRVRSPTFSDAHQGKRRIFPPPNWTRSASLIARAGEGV